MHAFLRPSRIAAVFAILLFLAINVIVQQLPTGARIDLTEDDLYTISDGTKQVLDGLEDPIDLTLFFSESVARDYPQIFSYGRRIRDLLREYESIAGDALRLDVVDPKPFTEEEDRAVAAGLSGLPTASGEQIYLGLVARDLTDREARIPFFSQERQDFLEYDLTKLIANLAVDEKPKVALITALPMAPGGFTGLGRRPSRGWVIYDQISQLFDVEQLEPGFGSIPAGTDLLLMVHPPVLTDSDLYAIDQFVLRGGRAAIFVDPYSEAAGGLTAQPGMERMAQPASNLDPLLGAWGVDLVDDRIVGDVEYAQRVNMGDGGLRPVKDYALWIAARGDSVAADDPVTGNLEQINLAATGALVPLEGATTVVEPLVRSSAVSALMDADRARGLPDPDRIMRDLVPDEERYTLIARITGPAASAYPDGPPESEEGGPNDGAEEAPGNEGQLPHLARSEGDIAVLVGADTDLFDDRFWVQTQDFLGQRIVVPIADNASLVINALDHLAGSDALIGLRGRGVADRPFEVVETLRREAEARFLAEEQRLEEELAATEQRLSELQSQIGEGDVLFSPEQDAEMERFRQRVLEIRQQLREVQRNLVRDIETLRARLVFFNIALVPILMIVAALSLAAWRRRRRARRLGS